MPMEDMGHQKPKHAKATYLRLVRDFRPHTIAIVFISLFIAVNAVLSVISPTLVSNLISGMIKNVDGYAIFQNEYAMKWMLITLICYTASAIAAWGADWILQKLIAYYGYSLRSRIKAKLDKMPLSYFDATETGEILSRGTNDVDNVVRNLPSVITSLIKSFIIVTGCIVSMLILCWQLALVILGTLPFTLLVVYTIGSKSNKQFKAYRKKYGVLEGQVEEAYSGFSILKLFGREEDVQNKFESINIEMTEADRKSQWISGFIYPIMRFIYNIGFAGVALVSGLIETEPSMVVAFIMFLNIFQSPFEELGQLVASIQSIGACSERIFALEDGLEQIENDSDCVSSNENIKGEVIFEHVYFSYDENKPLIEDMNLHTNPGDMIAIVGPTGAGKTTLVNLLMRFYEVDKGRIVLDGIDLKHYSRETLRKSIGMVLQDTWLFHGSIMENIRYGRNDATDEEVKNAAKAAHADHFIESLPGGYDFVLKEDATNISQGQRQLLTIARAMVSQPKIMILDEATSSVDTRTEQAIQDAMEKMMKGRTSFVIAHRLSTIKNAKVILVMKKGSIIEMGAHNELLRKKGFYAELYNSQFLGRSPNEE
ncbi:MAG: ABC transporter ATP-binding protein/permease [Bacilli bacterium]|nr:ABC transporter ATP-binding protein/permease [Bacilli bacterium]